MKTWRKAVLCTALVTLTFFSAVLTVRSPHAAADQSADTAYRPEAAPLDIMSDGNGDTYLLRELDGFIAVYGPPVLDVPLYKTDIRVDGLRLYDAMLLKTGITVTGRENLLKLLEDFSV